MADRIKGITIELNGDATGLDKALKGVNKEINDTQKELNDVNRLLKFNPKDVELLSQKQKLLTEQIDKTKEKLNTLKDAASQAKKQLETGEITQEQYRALQRELVETESKLKNLKTQSKETGKELVMSKLDFGGITSKVGKFAKGAATAIKGISAAVGTVAAEVAALGKKFVSSAKEVAEYGNNVDKMSQKLGLSAEGYQKWDYVLSQADVDIDSMQTGLKTLTNQIGNAQNGSKEAAKMFKELGISTEDLNKMSREEIFEATIKGFQGMEDSTHRAALANKMFGKSGQNLTPLFNETAESTEELIKNAEKYGMVMSADAVKASADFNDALDTLQKTASGLKNSMMSEFLPSLTQVTDGLALLLTGDPEGLNAVSEGVDGIVNSLTDLAPKIFEVGGKIVENLATAIIDNLPELMSSAVDLVMNLTQYILDNLPMILETGVTLLITIAEGLVEAIPKLIDSSKDAILKMVDYLTEPKTLALIISTGIELLGAIAVGLIDAIPDLVKKLPEIIENIVDTLTSKEMLDKILGVGKALVEGLWNGIKDMGQWIKDQIAGLGDLIIQAFKSVFGIKSPSRVMKKVVGKNLALGIGEGFVDEMDKVNKSMTDAISIPDFSAKANANLNIMAQPNNQLNSMLGRYLPYLANKQQIVLDTGVLVGETAPMYNKALGRIIRQGA